MLELTEVLELCIDMAAICMSLEWKSCVWKQSQFFRNIYHFDIEDAGHYAKRSPKKYMNPENEINLEEAVMKWHVKWCSCSMNIRGIVINIVASKMVKCTEIYFEATDGRIWWFSKKRAITNRHTFGEARNGPSERVWAVQEKLSRLGSWANIPVGFCYNFI